MLQGEGPRLTNQEGDAAVGALHDGSLAVKDQ